METENKDWKPEVGGKAWMLRYGNEVFEVMVDSIHEEKAIVSSYLYLIGNEARVSCRISSLYPTSEMAVANTVVRVYDLEGKEVLIPRAQDEIAMLKTELVVANAIIDNLSPRLEAALEMILELQDEKEQWEFERGGAANGGKSDQREGGC